MANRPNKKWIDKETTHVFQVIEVPLELILPVSHRFEHSVRGIAMFHIESPDVAVRIERQEKVLPRDPEHIARPDEYPILLMKLCAR